MNEVIQGGIVGTKFQGASYRTGETQLTQRTCAGRNQWARCGSGVVSTLWSIGWLLAGGRSQEADQRACWDDNIVVRVADR